MRPCECDTDGCRLCWLANNDERYRKLWSVVPPIPERTVLINLRRRPDRLASALAQCEKASIKPTVFPAIDGHALPLPELWKDGSGAYGCLESHRRVLERCILDGVNSVMVLEDDATLVPDFSTKLAELLAVLPSDWDAVFLGGQHITPPIQTDVPGIVRAVNCHRTHAYLVRGEYMRKLYQVWSTERGHCDHIWGRHQEQYQVFAPLKWMASQAAGVSNINGRTLPERSWMPRKVQAPRPCGTCRKAGV